MRTAFTHTCILLFSLSGKGHLYSEAKFQAYTAAITSDTVFRLQTYKQANFLNGEQWNGSQ